MKLTFSVLWFDDNPNFLDSLDLDPLKAAIKSWGFSPVFELADSPEKFNAHSPFKEIDLIVVDYVLGNHPHGEEFIRNVREHGVFTEVIFYSNVQSTELWEAIRKNQLEGIFVSNRQAILDKIERVGYQSVHKVLDLNNMRGIVMAEVGEIDLVLESILRGGITTLNADAQAAVYGGFHERAAKQADEQVDKLKGFKANPAMEDLIALSDSAKRWMSFRSLLKRHEGLKQQKVGDYQADVLHPRNCLAHGTPKRDGTGYVFSYQGKDYKYDEDIAKKLRHTIMEYRSLFEEILEKLGAAAGSAA